MGKGHEWFMVALDLKPVEVLVTYKVSIAMEDFAGNRLDPPYEKEMDGLFGGVLRMLEDLWDWLVDVATKIVDAVAEAVSFILDMLVSTARAIFEPIWNAIMDAFRSWGSSINHAMGNVLQQYKGTGEVEKGTALAHLNELLAESITQPLMVMMGVIAVLLAPYLVVFGSLITIIIDLLVSLILSAIAPDYLNPKYSGSSFLGLFDAMLAFLGVTHDTPAWFHAILIVLGSGYLAFVGIIYAIWNAIWKGPENFLASIVLSFLLLGFVIVIEVASLTIDRDFEEASKSASDDEKSELEEIWRANKLMILYLNFMSLLLSILFISSLKGPLSKFTSGLSAALAGLSLYMVGEDLGFWGGAHLG